MIQLKVFIIQTLEALGLKTWDEALLIQVLLIARYFFSCLASIKGELTSFFQEAAEKTKAFLNSHNLSIPPEIKLEDEATQKALYDLGSQTESFHDFGQLYGRLINPFSGNISSSSRTHIYNHLHWAHETVKENQPAGFKDPTKVPTFDFLKENEEKKSEAVRLAYDLEVIRLNPNVPFKENKNITEIERYCLQHSIRHNTAIHILSLVYSGRGMCWDDLCAADDTIPDIRFNRKIQDFYPMIRRFVEQKDDPVELIKALLFPPRKDESGLETSYIYTQILKYSKRKMPYIIDPSPDLVRKLTNDQYSCSVILSNPDVVQIYKKRFQDSPKVQFLNLADFSPSAEQCCITCFSRDDEWKPGTAITEDTRKSIEHGKLKRKIFSNVPDDSTVLVTITDTDFNKGKKILLREWARHGLLLYGILLLPTFKDVRGNELPKKIMLLLESASSRTEDHDVEILNMVHSSFTDDPEKAPQSTLRLIHKHVFLPYTDFVDDSRPVRTIFKKTLMEQVRKKPFKKRPASEVVTFIEEIKSYLHCTRITGPRSRNNPVVYKLSYSHAKDKKDKQKEIRPSRRDLMDYKEQTSKIKTASGQEKELEKLRTKTLSTIDSMFYGESYQPEITEDIRSFINKRLKKDPDHTYVPSLKALHYLFQEPLTEGRNAYNPKLCQEMLSINHPKLSTLVPDTSCTQETYMDAIKEAYPDKVRECPECDWSNNSKATSCDKCGADISDVKATDSNRQYHDLFKQILLIMRAASDYGFPVDLSPVRNLTEEYASRIRMDPEQQAARNALTMKAYTDDQEKKIMEEIFGKKGKTLSLNEMARRVYYILRYFLPCDLDEIRALTWNDYIRNKDTDLSFLIIYKSRDKSEKTEFYAETGKIRKFRHLPIAPLLDSLFEKYRKLLRAVDPEACSPDKPLLQLTDKNNTLHCMTWKQATKFDAFLDQASGRKDIHQEKTLPGKWRNVITDYYNKRGKLFDSNWKYRAKEVGMTDGESSYLRGVHADTTYDKHYCDYSNPFILLMMALKINRWVNQLLLCVDSSDLIITGQYQQITYCRLPDMDKETRLRVKESKYGTKATMTYDRPA